MNEMIKINLLEREHICVCVCVHLFETMETIGDTYQCTVQSLIFAMQNANSETRNTKIFTKSPNYM